ncbi:uncharacterized protein LOC144377748 [Ictidomys tridecemlineatus]
MEKQDDRSFRRTQHLCLYVVLRIEPGLHLGCTHARPSHPFMNAHSQEERMLSGCQSEMSKPCCQLPTKKFMDTTTDWQISLAWRCTICQWRTGSPWAHGTYHRLST